MSNDIPPPGWTPQGSTDMATPPDMAIPPPPIAFDTWSFPSFPYQAIPNTAYNARQVLVGDANKDGRNDIVVSAQQVEIFPNVGGSQFGPSATYSAANNLVFADLNNDTRQDLVGVSGTSLIVRYIDSAGGITTIIKSTSSLHQFWMVAVADINNDSNPDIIALTNFGFSTFLNDGMGGLADAVASPLAIGGTAFVASDLDQDGDSDLAIASGDKLRILTGDGSGTFALANTIVPEAGQSISDIQIADIDGNRVPEILAQYKNGTKLLKSDRMGGYAVSVIAATQDYLKILLKDINNDGQLDLALYGSSPLGPTFTFAGVRVLLGDGAGNFAYIADAAVDGVAVAIDFADVTGDRKIDLVAATWEGRVRIVPGNDSGRFCLGICSSGRSPVHAAPADLNGDGAMDVVVTNFGSSTIDVLLGNGRGGFAPSRPIAVATAPTKTVIGDFNGDGKSDLLVVGSVACSLILANGLGSFAAPRTVSLYATDVVAVDWNQDGKLDIVTVYRAGGGAAENLIFWTNDGLGNFTKSKTCLVGNFATNVIAEFVDNNSQPDIIIGHEQDLKISVFLNPYPWLGSSYPLTGDVRALRRVGGTVFASTTTGTFLYGIQPDGRLGSALVWNNRFVSNSGDFDGDGIRDVVTGGGKTVQVLLGLGLDRYVYDLDVGANGTVAAVADLNGDRRDDFVILNTSSGFGYVLLNRTP